VLGDAHNLIKIFSIISDENGKKKDENNKDKEKVETEHK
jgi:hypothetical protein